MDIGFYLYPDMTQLDFTGPYDILARVPGARLHLAAKSLDPVRSDSGLRLLPTVTLADCPALDVLCVPGGPHVDRLFGDEETLSFLRRQAETARYVTSVCTGSLILGAAGLLEGYRATSHWTSVEMLSAFGAIPTEGRVVKDRNRISGGGVTAGIDFALTLVAEMRDEKTAKIIQLATEYNPEPPFRSGHPSVAEPEVLQAAEAIMKDRLMRRRAAVESAA